MKAIAFIRPLPIEAEDSLVELDLPEPEFGPRDLLVNVRAVSVNPVDTKVRGARHQGSASDKTGKPRVLGWDAAGVVVGKGAAVTGFNVGDEVYYAGALDRPGSNAEYQAVDERLVGRKPKSIWLCRGRRATLDEHYRLGIAIRPVGRSRGQERGVRAR